jgi:WD40 repeat protein
VKIERPRFELTRVFSDGNKEAPEIIPVGCMPWNTQMERRGLLGIGLGVASLLFLLDGKAIAQSASSQPLSDATASQSNSAPVKVPDKQLNAHTEQVSSLVVGTGATLASGSWDDTIKLWSLPDGKLLAILRDHKSNVTELTSSPDGKTLASGSWDNTIKLWSLPEGKLLSSLAGHPDLVSLRISPSGELISGLSDKTIKIWSLPEGRLLGTLRGHRESVLALAISQDANVLISGSDDKTIKLWSLVERKLLGAAGWHRDGVNALVVSVDGKVLASGSSDNTIKLWSLAKRRLLATLRGHQDSVNKLILSPDGNTLVSCASDRTIKLWSFPAGKLLATLEGHQTTPTALAISGDGKTLASGDASGVIILWDLEKRSFLSFLFDPKASRNDAIAYNVYDRFSGTTLTYTLPCGSPIPPGAVCTCNCVSGTYSPPSYSAPTRGGSYCICNKVCTCIPVPSDRGVKEAFETTDPMTILKRLADLPIQSWNYNWDDGSVRHIGPMAQDFAALFGVGEDDKHIHPVDAQGVAFAAIQALYHLLKEKAMQTECLRTELQQLQDGNEILKSRLDALEESAGHRLGK